jgi:hypothetical protein
MIEPILSGSEDEFEKPPKFYSLSPSMSPDDLDFFPGTAAGTKPLLQQRLSISKRITPVMLPATNAHQTEEFVAANWVKAHSRSEDLEESLKPAPTLSRDPLVSLANVVTPSVSEKEPAESAELGGWEILISVKRVAHPALNLKKRIHMRELFANDSALQRIAFPTVKEHLLRVLDESQQLSSSFPYLPHDGCCWNDLRKYFKYSERFKLPRGTDLSLLLEVNLRRQKFHRSSELTCEFSSWIDLLTQQVSTLPPLSPLILDSPPVAGLPEDFSRPLSDSR